MKRFTSLRRLHEERGQAIVTMALASVFFIMILSIAVEEGLAYMERRQLQNTADAAALAGAQELPLGATAATNVANAYVQSNRPGASATITIGANAYSITVYVEKKATGPLTQYFTYRTNCTTSDRVCARATAKLRSIPNWHLFGVTAFTVNHTTFTQSQSGGLIDLKVTSGSGSAGNYQFISIGANGGAVIRDNMKGGSVTAIQDPGTTTAPGNTVGPARQGISDRMTAAKANSCYYISDILNADGSLNDRCNPLIGATRGANGFTGIEPTAVVLIPIMTDASFNTTTTNGNEAVRIQQLNGVYEFGFYAIDPSTVEKYNGIGPTCSGSGGCEIPGRFLKVYTTPLLVNGATTDASGNPFCPSGGTDCFVDFNSNSLYKVVVMSE